VSLHSRLDELEEKLDAYLSLLGTVVTSDDFSQTSTRSGGLVAVLERRRSPDPSRLRAQDKRSVRGRGLMAPGQK